VLESSGAAATAVTLSNKTKSPAKDGAKFMRGTLPSYRIYMTNL